MHFKTFEWLRRAVMWLDGCFGGVNCGSCMTLGRSYFVIQILLLISALLESNHTLLDAWIGFIHCFLLNSCWLSSKWRSGVLILLYCYCISRDSYENNRVAFLLTQTGLYVPLSSSSSPSVAPPSVPKTYILMLHGQMIKGARSGHTQTQRRIMRPRWAGSTASEWPQSKEARTKREKHSKKEFKTWM